jgi:cell division transport system ATP-binding protein
MIQMREVSKTYDTGVVALNHVNVDIKKGEFVFVVGPSGAGKSTFIKMLFREELPTEGKLLVNGHDVVHMERSEVPYLRRELGVIFQDYRLLPDKTVFENVAFALQVIEAPRRTMQRSVNSVLDVVGLRDKYRSFPSQLSGGEQQRVAIARAMATRCCSPPESCEGKLRYLSRSPTTSSTEFTLRCIVRRGASITCRANATFSNTVLSGSRR